MLGKREMYWMVIQSQNVIDRLGSMKPQSTHLLMKLNFLGLVLILQASYKHKSNTKISKKLKNVNIKRSTFYNLKTSSWLPQPPGLRHDGWITVRMLCYILASPLSRGCCPGRHCWEKADCTWVSVWLNRNHSLKIYITL